MNETEICAMDMSSNPDFYHDGLYDNTVACWLTNYVLASCGVLLIVFVLRRQKPNPNHGLHSVRTFIMLKFASLCISVTLAGFVHEGLFGQGGQISYDKSKTNYYLWLCVEFFLMCSGSFTVTAAFFHWIHVPKPLLHCWVFLISFISIGYVLELFKTDAFEIAGMFGEFLPDMFLACAILHEKNFAHELTISWKSKHFGPGRELAELKRIQEEGQHVNWALTGIFIIFVGACIQVFLGPYCGDPCPVQCPFPALVFDHNALFHVCQALGMCVLGRGMAILCDAIEGIEDHLYDGGFEEKLVKK